MGGRPSNIVWRVRWGAPPRARVAGIKHGHRRAEAVMRAITAVAVPTSALMPRGSWQCAVQECMICVRGGAQLAGRHTRRACVRARVCSRESVGRPEVGLLLMALLRGACARIGVSCEAEREIEMRRVCARRDAAL